jgi:acyl-CoA thioesterase-1
MSLLRTTTLAAAVTCVSMGVMVTAGGVALASPRGGSGGHGDGGTCCSPGPVARIDDWRVWPLGDSITLGRTVINGQVTDGMGGYRARLQAKVTMRIHWVGTMLDSTGAHDGHSGWRADELVPLVRDWTTAVGADIILLHIGTNDLGQGDTAEQLTTDVNAIIREIRAVSRARIYVAKLPPIPANAGARETQRLRFNDALTGNVATWNAQWGGMFVVDQMNVTISSDNVHPSEPTGYDQEATNWSIPLSVLPTHILR